MSLRNAASFALIALAAALPGTAAAESQVSINVPYDISGLSYDVGTVLVKCDLCPGSAAVCNRDAAITTSGTAIMGTADDGAASGTVTVFFNRRTVPAERMPELDGALKYHCYLELYVDGAYHQPGPSAPPDAQPAAGTPFAGEVSGTIPAP
jgi:hypothetical protein